MVAADLTQVAEAILAPFSGKRWTKALTQHPKADGWWAMWSVLQINKNLRTKTDLWDWNVDLNTSSGHRCALSSRAHLSDVSVACEWTVFVTNLLPNVCCSYLISEKARFMLRRWTRMTVTFVERSCGFRGAVFSVCTSCGSYFLSASSLMANTRGGGTWWGRFSSFLLVTVCSFVDCNGETHHPRRLINNFLCLGVI